MSRHVTEELLRKFVDGRVDDEVAVAVALHIDACPWCCTRAASLEPLHAAFAAIDDPVCPPQLADEILAALHAPPPQAPLERAPTAEIGAATCLLTAAALLLVALGDPAGLAAELAVGSSALLNALVLLAEQVETLSPWLTVLAAGLGFGAAAALAARAPSRGDHSPRGWA